MNSKLKRDLLVTVLCIVSILCIAGSFFLGKIMSPLLFLIIYLIGFNFVLVPIFTINYYRMYDMDSPGWKAFIPLYNVTLTSKPSLAIASYILIILNIVVMLLVTNVWIFEFLGDKMFFIISDGLPLVLMITISLYYLVTGIALATPLIQCRDLYLEFFRDSDEVSTGFGRFLMKSGSITKYLEVCILILPVFRIIPMFIGFSRITELNRYNVSFLDF